MSAESNLKNITPYLFLCGVGRSGTTIFRTGLGKHPEIDYNGKENNIIQELLEVAMRNCSMKSRKYAMMVEQDRYDEIFRIAIEALIWNQPTPSKSSDAANGSPSINPKVRTAAINPSGDQLDYIRQVFPGSKIISLVRNGVEVVSSRTQYKSFAKQTFEQHCDIWNRAEPIVAWGKDNPSHFRLFRQEWFYQPEKLKTHLDELFCWLGIEGSDLSLNHITGTLRHPTDSAMELGADKFASVSDDQKKDYFLAKRERWRDWTADQRILFSDRCSDFMQQLGYEIPWQK